MDYLLENSFLKITYSPVTTEWIKYDDEYGFQWIFKGQYDPDTKIPQGIVRIISADGNIMEG